MTDDIARILAAHRLLADELHATGVDVGRDAGVVGRALEDIERAVMARLGRRTWAQLHHPAVGELKTEMGAP